MEASKLENPSSKETPTKVTVKPIRSVHVTGISPKKTTKVSDISEPTLYTPSGEKPALTGPQNDTIEDNIRKFGNDLGDQP